MSFDKLSLAMDREDSPQALSSEASSIIILSLKPCHSEPVAGTLIPSLVKIQRHPLFSRFLEVFLKDQTKGRPITYCAAHF